MLCSVHSSLQCRKENMKEQSLKMRRVEKMNIKNYEDDDDDDEDDTDDDEDGNDCKVGQWTPLQGCPVSAPAG